MCAIMYIILMITKRDKPRLTVELDPSEVKLKNKARAKALSEGVTLRDVVIEALEAYVR